MNPLRATSSVLLGILALLAALEAPPAAAQPFPVTPVFQVNTYTDGDQGAPVLASNGKGRFVVVWQSGTFDEVNPQDGDESGVYAQVYDASGARIGGEIEVNQTTTGSQGSPAAAMDEDGGFVVVWISENPVTFDSRVLVRRFAPTGAPLGDELAVSVAVPLFSVAWPDVALDGEGRFVVAWTRYDDSGEVLESEIDVRRFDAAGNPIGDPFVASGAEGEPQGPALAVGPAGDFSVIYEAYGPSPGGSSLLARRFTASGEPVGGAVVLEGPAGFQPTFPAAATRPDGSLVVAWSDVGEIFGRLLDPSGAPRGPAFQVNTRSGDFDMAQVAVDAAGGFLIAWTEYEEEGSGVVLGQRFDASGARQGAELRLGKGSGIPLGDGALALVDSPVVTISPNGDFGVARTASPQAHEGSDGNGEGVFARIFRLPPLGADACAAEGGHLVCDVRRDGGEPDLDLELAAEAGDVPLAGNLDGDVRDDLCLYRDGRFLCDTAHDGGSPEVTIAFGGAAVDVPLLGDLNGDGRDDACVRRRRRFLCDTAHNGGTAEIKILFGRPADVPLLGDVDGDGDDDPCLYRAGRFSCDTVHDGRTAEVSVFFGSGGDVPLLGDVDKDGDDDFCVFTGDRFLCDTAHDGDGAEVEIPFAGPAGTIPILGNLDGF